MSKKKPMPKTADPDQNRSRWPTKHFSSQVGLPTEKSWQFPVVYGLPLIYSLKLGILILLNMALPRKLVLTHE